jgi:hypothetical protein
LVAVGLWIAVIATVVVAVVAAVVVAVVVRRRGGAAAPEQAPPEPSRRAAPPATPMTDLESALARVTDRDGRPIREKIDAEKVHVDPLRDPDDTGPLLRRALDSVAHHDDHHDDQHDDQHDGLTDDLTDDDVGAGSADGDASTPTDPA